MSMKFDRIETLRDRINDSDCISDADREALIAFSDELTFLDTRYSNHRHLKLLNHCTILAGESMKYTPDELPDCELVDTLENEDAVKEIGRWIKRTFDNEETKRDYRVAVRMFGEHTTDGPDIPEPLQKLSAGTPRNYNPMPDPAKMLWWDDHIEPMLEAANHLRDKAVIAVAWDSGARSEEFCSLRVGDVSDHKHGLKISVDGKQGERSILLITSAPYLRQWLNVHPGADNPTAPLWSKLNEPVISREFSSPGQLREDIQDAIAYRQDVAGLVDSNTSPASPDAFLTFLVILLRDEAASLHDETTPPAGQAETTLHSFTERLIVQSEGIKRTVGEPSRDPFETLVVVLNTDFSRDLHDGHQIQALHDHSLSADVKSKLERVLDIIVHIGVARQHLKTLYFQRTLTALSRNILYVGLPALAVLVVTVLVLSGASGPTLEGTALDALVVGAVTVAATPVAVFSAYVLRIATITRRTGAVLPFVMPE